MNPFSLRSRGIAAGYSTPGPAPDDMAEETLATTTTLHPQYAGFESNPQLAVLSELGIAAVVLGLDGTIRHWNPFAEALYGLSEHEMLGRHARTVRLAGDDGHEWMLHSVMRRGHWHGVLNVLDASGALLSLDARATVMRDDCGEAIGVLGAFRELDGPRQSNGADVEVRGELLDIDAPATPKWGYWEWDPRENHGSVSGVLRSLLQLENDRDLTMEEAAAAFSPEDRAAVEAVWESLRNGESDVATYSHRVQRPDGGVSWIETNCEAIRSGDGDLIRIRGTTQDITPAVELTRRMKSAAEIAQSTLDTLDAQVAILDAQGRIVAVNRAWREFAGAEGAKSDFTGADYLATCANSGDPSSQAAGEGIRSVLNGEQEAFELEYACHSPDERRWFMLRATRCSGAADARVVVIHENVTPQHELRERVAIQEGMLNRLNAAVVVTDADGKIAEWNEAAEQLFGWTAAEAVGRDPLEVLDIVVADTTEAPSATDRVGSFDGEYCVRRRDGSSTTVYARMQAMADESGERTGVVSVAIDIGERKAFERELVRAHNYMEAITDSVGEGIFALDTAGRVTYMNAAAQELLGWSLEQLEGRVMHPITHSQHADGSEHAIEECPIVRSCAGGPRVRINDDVFIRADGSHLPVAYTAAPFSADQDVEGCVVVFADISERKAGELAARRDREKRSWVTRVQEALADDGFELYGQPIVDLQNDEVVQRELLIRMKPQDGSSTMISPGLFLPAAEESGLISQIDRWVINQSADIAATGAAVELNVSAASISDPSLVDYIRRAIGRSGADPASLVFEITETTLISDEAAARAFVEGLHRLGCKIALDDFGTGYGGFTYLKQLPIDYLKIDIEFVRDLKYDPASQRVVEAVVNLARGFGLITVGEGVEDEETLELLRQLGVDRAQGFYIGRPAPLDIGNTRTSHEEAQ